jgi:hypothetical protein
MGEVIGVDPFQIGEVRRIASHLPVATTRFAHQAGG